MSDQAKERARNRRRKRTMPYDSPSERRQQQLFEQYLCHVEGCGHTRVSGSLFCPRHNGERA